MSEEKKYDILPGVELPDIKSIKAAASDFSVSNVSEVKIDTPKVTFSSDVDSDGFTAEELAALQALGDKVAADEALAALESRKRMDQIMSTAVKAPESIVDLLNYNRDKVSEERIREKEEELRKAEELKQAEIEKERQREERRQMQQRLLEEARERAAAMREAEKRGIKADESLLDNKTEDETADKTENVVNETDVTEAAVSEPVKEESVKEEPVKAEPVKDEATIKSAEIKPAETKKPDEPVQPSIATAEETFDDFSEFLDEGQK